MVTLVLGGSGLVGSAICQKLQEGHEEFLAPSSKMLNLMDQASVSRYFSENTFNKIYFCAAKVGGVFANLERPIDFIMSNLQMEINVFSAAISKEIGRLIFISSSSVYPEFGKLPFSEDQILSGKLSESIKPYALAKISGMEIVSQVNKKFSLPWISVIPANVYGLRDNFRNNQSHVVPALIKRILYAKRNNERSIKIFGSPENERDFLFSEDLAQILSFLDENYYDSDPINIGPGKATKIRELANVISRRLDFVGEYDWHFEEKGITDKKFLDNSKLRDLGWKDFTEINEGIAKVIEWLLDAEDNGFNDVRWN